MSDLGQFQVRANEWRAAMAAMASHGDAEQLLHVFERAIAAFASMVEHGLNRADAAEALTNLAEAYGVELGPDEIEQHIAEAFSKIKVNGAGTRHKAQPTLQPKLLKAYSFPEEDKIPARAWLYARHYIRGFVSATV